MEVDGSTVGRIGPGLVVLLGVGSDDREEDADYLCRKIVRLRVFPDEKGKFNLSLADLDRELLVVSQFTLYADCRKGRRPSFTEAAAPERAQTLYEYFVGKARSMGARTAAGRFQAKMAVRLTNDGPVTLVLDSVESGRDKGRKD